MKVNIKGLINRLNNLRERLNNLFDKLEKLEDLDYDIAVEDVQQYFQVDDTFNLSIANDVLEQADKLDRVLEIIKEKRVNVDLLYYSKNLEDYNRNITTNNRLLTQEEFDLLKEVLL